MMCSGYNITDPTAGKVHYMPRGIAGVGGTIVLVCCQEISRVHAGDKPMPTIVVDRPRWDVAQLSGDTKSQYCPT